MQRISILGLGRMGAAIARRLSGSGWHVTGWTRSRRTVPGVETANSPVEAVAEADAVVLALYDGAACREVLDQLRPALTTTTTVINTSTVGPEEATAFAHQLGPSYLHAPVVGSVPAAETGRLVLLTGGEGARTEQARSLLHHLGDVREVGDARTAAALKLVVNATLAGSVVALRHALYQAQSLGLPRDAVLDTLERGPLGGLVARKRSVVEGGDQPAEFSAGALAKDMSLLGAASGLPLGPAAEFLPHKGDAAVDIAHLATTPPADEAVLEPLRAYIRGHATGDPTHFRAAFLPSAHVEGMRDGAFVSWPLDDYCALFTGEPALDEAERSRGIDAITVRESVATAWMTLRHGKDMFTDIFLLVHTEDGWRIANKAYHRH